MAADADADSSPMHIVIFPWLAFGHMIPLLELAERLVARGHRVSFVSTPRNLSRLRPVVGVHFIALPLPRVDGLPEGVEATSDLPPSPGKLTDLLLKAADGLAGAFSAFLDDASSGNGNGKKPDWLVVDNLHYLVATAAADRGVPSVMFLPFAAASTALWGVPRVSAVVDPELGASVSQRFVLTYQCCKIVAQRCSAEFDPEAVPLLPSVLGKPFAPMGLLPPTLLANNGGDELVSWLDRHPAKSVVYVALGTEAPLTTELVHELAIGLELAGTPFLWALRKVGDQDVLPPGFEERTKGRGLVAMGMVPQTRMLAHGSVGAFLTHSGPGSAIEGLQYGHPLIMLPFFQDQQTGAEFMERKKVGLLVPRNGEDGLSFDRQGVASTVRAVVVDEQAGRVFAANAKKWQEVVVDTACHERYIDEFVQQLRFYKDK